MANILESLKNKLKDNFSNFKEEKFDEEIDYQLGQLYELDNFNGNILHVYDDVRHPKRLDRREAELKDFLRMDIKGLDPIDFVRFSDEQDRVILLKAEQYKTVKELAEPVLTALQQGEWPLKESTLNNYVEALHQVDPRLDKTTIKLDPNKKIKDIFELHKLESDCFYEAKEIFALKLDDVLGCVDKTGKLVPLPKELKENDVIQFAFNEVQNNNLPFNSLSFKDVIQTFTNDEHQIVFDPHDKVKYIQAEYRNARDRYLDSGNAHKIYYNSESLRESQLNNLQEINKKCQQYIDEKFYKSMEQLPLSRIVSCVDENNLPRPLKPKELEVLEPYKEDLLSLTIRGEGKLYEIMQKLSTDNRKLIVSPQVVKELNHKNEKINGLKDNLIKTEDIMKKQINEKKRPRYTFTVSNPSKSNDLSM